MPHPDPAKNQWALELREITEKKVSFALIDLDADELKWISAPEYIDWWTSMTAFSGNRIFLHHYRYPDLPEPTDLSALSVNDGEIVWTLANYVFVRTLDGEEIEVAGRTGDGFKYAVCLAENGRVLQEQSSSEISNEIILKQPVRYKEGDNYFGELSAFLQATHNIHNPLCIDYLDRRPYMMFSYYIYEQDKVAQYLLMINKEKEVLLHEQLSKGRDGVGQSTILLKDSTLVYLKGNTEFKSLKLS